MLGEKGDLGRLCLCVLHVLCILSFVMISTSEEGGMLASGVQERSWVGGGDREEGGELGCCTVQNAEPPVHSLTPPPLPTACVRTHATGRPASEH